MTFAVEDADRASGRARQGSGDAAEQNWPSRSARRWPTVDRPRTRRSARLAGRPGRAARSRRAAAPASLRGLPRAGRDAVASVAVRVFATELEQRIAMPRRHPPSAAPRGALAGQGRAGFADDSRPPGRRRCARRCSTTAPTRPSTIWCAVTAARPGIGPRSRALVAAVRGSFRRRPATSAAQVEQGTHRAAGRGGRAAGARRRPRTPRPSPTCAHNSRGLLPTDSSPHRRAPVWPTSPATSRPIGRRLERLPREVAADRERMERVHADRRTPTRAVQPCRRAGWPPTTSATSPADRGVAGQPVGAAARHAAARSASSGSTARSMPSWPEPACPPIGGQTLSADRGTSVPSTASIVCPMSEGPGQRFLYQQRTS